MFTTLKPRIHNAALRSDLLHWRRCPWQLSAKNADLPPTALFYANGSDNRLVSDILCLKRGKCPIKVNMAMGESIIVMLYTVL